MDHFLAKSILLLFFENGYVFAVGFLFTQMNASSCWSSQAPCLRTWFGLPRWHGKQVVRKTECIGIGPGHHHDTCGDVKDKTEALTGKGQGLEIKNCLPLGHGMDSVSSLILFVLVFCNQKSFSFNMVLKVKWNNLQSFPVGEVIFFIQFWKIIS